MNITLRFFCKRPGTKSFKHHSTLKFLKYPLLGMLVLLLPLFSSAQLLLDPASGSGPISVITASSAGTNSSIAVAYSIRQLKTTYDHTAITPPVSVTGFTNSSTPLIRVKRSFDNASLDIGYDGNGNLDTVTLKNFVTGKVGAAAATNPNADGRVSIFYDQSGNSRDASVGSAIPCPGVASEPYIITAGVIERNGGGQIGIAGKNGGMLGDGGTAFDNAASGFNRYGIVNDRTLNVVSQPRAWSTVGGAQDGNGTYLVDRNGGTGIQDAPLTCIKAVGNYWAAQIRNEASDISQSFAGIIPISVNRSDNVTIIRSGDNYPMYVNGVLAGTGVLAGNNSQSPVRIGYGCQFGENVYYGEFILFPSALSNADLAVLNASQNSYFALGATPGLWTGTTSSDWSVASNWSNNTVPDAITEVQIPSGTVNNLTITGGQTTLAAKSLSVASGATVTINGNLSVTGNVIVNGTISGTGTLSMTGSLDQTISGTPSANVSNLTITNTAGTVTATTNLNVSGTLTVNSGAIFSMDAAAVINSSGAAGTLTGSGTVMATRITSVADFQSQYKFSTYTLSGLTVNYAGAGAQIVNLGVNYSNLIVSGSGIKTLSAAVTATNISGNITVNGGTLNTNNFNIASPASRTITVASGALLNAGTSVISFGVTTKQLTVNGTLQTANLNGLSGTTTTTVSSTNTPTITLASTSTVEYNASSAQAVTGTGVTYGNVTLSSGSKTISTAMVIAGNLLIQSGATYNGAANPTLNVGGNFTNNGTYTSGTGAVTFNGTGSQAISSTTTPLVFGGSVTFTGASSTATMLVNATAATTLTVNANKTLDLGTFTFNRATSGGTLTVAGTLELGGNTGGQTGSNFPTNYTTLTLTGGTIEYNGSNAITQTVFNTTAYHNLTLTNGSGTGNAAKISNGNFTIAASRTMTINSGVTFTPTAGNVITGTTATLTGTGTIEITGGVALTTQYNFTTRVLTNLTLTYVGTSSIAAGTYANLNITSGTSTITSGPVIVTGNITIGNGTTFAAGTNAIQIAGNWVNNGTFTTGTATVTFNGTSAQSISGTALTGFSSLTISNVTNPVSLNRNINVSGTLTLNGAATSLIPDDTVIINNSAAAGTITGTGTVYVTRTLATADYQNQYKFTTNTLTSLTVNYSGAGNQTVTVGTAGINYSNLIVSGTGTKTLSAAVTSTNVTGNITVNSATLATNNFNIASPAIRTITVASGATLNAGTSVISFGATTKQITISGTLQTANSNGLSGSASTTVSSTNTPTITLNTGSIVEYTGAGGQVVTTGTTYSYLTLSSNSKTIASGTLTVSGDLNVGTGATFLGTTNNPTINLAGDFINDGTFTQGSGTMTLNGATQTIGGNTTPATFSNLTVSSTVSATLLVNATISGLLTVSSTRIFDLGAFTCNRTASGGTLTVAGTLKLAGKTGGQTGSNFPLNFTTLTLTGGTIEYNGSSADTQTVFATTAYHNLTLTNGSGTGNAVKVSTSNFTIASTRTMTVGSGVTFTPGSGNVITGTGATLTGTGGTIDVTGGATLATQYAFGTTTLTNLTVNYTGNGSISAGTYSSLTLNGAGTITLTGNVVVVTDVTIGSSATLASAGFQIDVNGNWTNNGAYTPGGSLVRFVGTSTQTISGTSSTSFANVTITNIDAPIIVSRATNISGTLTLSGVGATIIPDDTVVINTSAGTSTITGTGTLKVSRIAATADLVNQYKFNTYTLTSMTVDYAGLGAQSINNTVGTYGALIVSGTATKTLQGSITVTNDVTFTSGSFATGGFNLTTSGNIVNNGVTMSGTGNFNLNGTSKTISGTSSSAFPVLVIGAGATYTVNNNNTCTGLTFTAGGTASSFTHGTNSTLTINGNVTVNQPTAAVTTAWNINAATVNITGTLNHGGSNATAGRVAQIVLTTGALTIVGNTTITGGLAANTVIDLTGGAANITFGGTVTITTLATLNPGTSSTVNYNGTVAQTIPFSGTFIYYNLNTANSNGSGATLGAAVTAANVANNMTVVSGLLNTGNFAVTLGASKTLTISTGAVFNAGTSLVTFGVTSTLAVNGTFRTAKTNGFSGTATTSVNSTNTPTVTFGTDGTVEYSATGQTVTNGHNYNNLTFSNTSGTNTANANIVVNGDLTTAAGGTFALTTFTLSGTLTSVSNSGIITTTCPTATSAVPIPAGKTWGGTINYAATTGVQTIVSGTYNNLTLSNTSATNTAGGDITINGNFTANGTGGTFAMSTFAMSGTPGTITNPGTITTGNTSSAPLPSGESWGAGTVTYTVTTGGQTIASGTYTNLTLSNTSATNTAGGDLVVNGTLQATGGASGALDMSTYALSGSFGTVTNAGTIRTANTSSTPLPGGKSWGAGTVNYNATNGGQTIVGGTYATLTMGNTTGTQTAAGTLTVSGVLNITTSNDTLNMGTAQTTVSGSYNNLGVIRTQNTSNPFAGSQTSINGTVMFDAPSTGQGIFGLTFTNLVLDGSAKSFAATPVNISGEFRILNGTSVTLNSGNTINYNGSGPQTIAALSYSNLTIGARGSGSTIVTFTGTTNISGTATFTTTATYDVTGSTINYNGAAQTVSPNVAYNNLTISGTGAKTTTGVTVNGILSSEGSSAVLVSVAPTFGPSATLQFNKSSYPASIGLLDWPASFAGEGGVILNAASASIVLSNNARTVSFGISVNVTGAFRVNLGSQTHTCQGLTLGGVLQATGSYNATNTSTFFTTGAGQITNTSPVSTWTGNTSTDWEVTTNWSPNTLPTSTRDALIPTGATRQPTMTAAVNCRNLTIQSGATVTSGNFTVNIFGDYTNSGGTLTLGSSPIVFQGTTNQSVDAFTTTGAITVSKTAGTITLNGVSAATSITFNPGANTTNTSLSIANSFTLSGAFTVNSLAGNANTVNLAGAGTLTCASFVLGTTVTPTVSVATTLNTTLANIVVTGNLTITSFRSTFNNNPTFNHNSGMVSVGGSLTTVVAANAASIASYIMRNSSPQLNLSGATPFTNTGVTGIHTITLNGTGAIVNYNGTAAQAARATTYTTFEVNNKTGVTLAGASTIKTLTVGSDTTDAIFNDGGFVITPGTSPVLNLISGRYNLGAGTATTWPAWTTTNFTAGTTVGYTATVNQTVSTTPSYPNLTFSGANTKTTAAGTLTITGNWTVGSTTALNTNSTNVALTGNTSGSGTITNGSGTLSIGGNWLHSGTYNANTGTVNYNGTGAQSIGALSYNNLTVSGTRTGSPIITLPSGTVSVSGTFTNSATGVGSITVTGNTIDYNGTAAQTIAPFSYNNLTVSGNKNGGAITLGAGTINVEGAFTTSGASNIGSYVTTGNTVNYSVVTGGQSIAAFVYNNLTLSNTSNSNTAAGNIVVDGTLTQASGGTLDMGAFTLTGFLTTVSNNGTISTTNMGQTPLASGVTWGGTGSVTYLVTTGAQSIMTGTYQNLTVSNISGIQTATGNIAINGVLTLNGGILDMGTYALSGATMTTAGTGTVTTQNTSSTPLPSGRTWNYLVQYNGSGSQTIVSGNYSNLTASGGNRIFASSGTVGISGTFTPGAGTYTTTGSTVDFNGTGAQTIPTMTYNNLTISNTRSGSPAITLPSGTITIIGNFSATSTGVGSFVTTGNTVAYTGTTQLVGGITYGDLTIGGTGLKTLGANATVNGTITVGGSTGLDAAGFTLTVLGAWINNATFTGNTSTVVFSGSSQQTMSGTVTPTFNALTVDNSNGVVMSASVTVGGLLSLTSGKLSVGSNTLTLNGTISSTATNSLTSNGSSNITIGSTGGNGTLFFDQTANGTTNKFATVTVNRSGNTITMGNNLEVGTALNLTAGKLAIGSNTLTLSGTLSNTSTNCLVANASSNLAVNGTGALGNSIFFDQTTAGTTNRLVNLSYNRSSQTITLGNTVEVTGTVTPTAGSLASGGNLILVSDASGTARIANGGCTTCSYISGTVIVQRNIPAVARRWRFMGSSVQGATLADWKGEIFLTGAGGSANGFDSTASNAASVYAYDETITTGDFNTGWVAATNATNPITTGKGFRVFIRGDRSNAGRLSGTVNDQNEVTMDLRGTPNQGDIVMPVTLTKSGSGGTYVQASDGWNLLSNPYPSPYDWNAHYDNGGFHANLDSRIWILSSGGSYKDFNALSNAGLLTGGIIPPGASFWVKANNGGVPSLTFKEQFKVATNPISLFKTSEEESFTVELSSDSITNDATMIKYMAGSTPNYDNYDNGKLSGIITVSAWGSDNLQLSLSVRPPVEGADTVKLRVDGAAGNYKLTFKNSEALGVTDDVVLIDTYKGTVTDIKATKVYDFAIESGVAASTGFNRFYLIIGGKFTAITDVLKPVKRSAIYPIPARDILTIDHTRAIEAITVFDISGRAVLTAKGAGNMHQLDVNSLQTGVYIVEYSDAAGETVKMKFTKE